MPLHYQVAILGFILWAPFAGLIYHLMWRAIMRSTAPRKRSFLFTCSDCTSIQTTKTCEHERINPRCIFHV